MEFTETYGPTRRRVRIRDGGALTAENRVGRLRSGATYTTAKGLSAMFLPSGYPDTVTADYTAFMAWDALQFLLSTILGTLATRAVLVGVGVGDKHASALSGTVLWVLRDGAGVLGKLTFTVWLTSSMDTDAKRWRLIADVANDAAFLIELMACHRGSVAAVIALCLAAIVRSMTMVAGGTSRFALTRHFARVNSTGDVSAKDSTQKTVVSVVGLALGVGATAIIPSKSMAAVLGAFAVLALAHLWANFMAVRAVVPTTMNVQLAVISLDAYARDGAAPTPQTANRAEAIWTWRPRWRVAWGVSLEAVLCGVPAAEREGLLRNVLAGLEDEVATVVRSPRGDFHVIRRDDAVDAVALRVLHSLHTCAAGGDVWRVVPLSPVAAFDKWVEACRAVGWNVTAVRIHSGAHCVKRSS